VDLQELRHERFVVMHDIQRPGRANVDHLVSGPTGVFLIETKHRRYLDAHLGRVMRQALELHGELDVFVTPVICLEQRSYGPRRLRNVWVMGRPELLPFLRAQRKPRLPFERLAAWADSL
jgi:hypothetical protein